MPVGKTPPAATIKPYTHLSVHAGELYLVWRSAPGGKVQRSTSPALDQAAWTTLPATEGLGGFAEPFTSPRAYYRLLLQP